MKILAQFYVIKDLRGFYFKNDHLTWVNELDEATTFSSLEQLKRNEKVEKLIKSQCRVFKITMTENSNKTGILFIKEKVSML